MDFKAPRELWNLLRKAVPDKLHGSGGHSKCNYLQDRANFHRFRAWQTVLIVARLSTSLPQLLVDATQSLCCYLNTKRQLHATYFFFNIFYSRCCFILCQGFMEYGEQKPSKDSQRSVVIDPFHKSHNALDKYPIMQHFVTEMCTHVHIFVKKWCIVGYGTGALWDLCNRFIPG